MFVTCLTYDGSRKNDAWQTSKFWDTLTYCINYDALIENAIPLYEICYLTQLYIASAKN